MLNKCFLNTYRAPIMHTYFGRALFASRFGHQISNEQLFCTETNKFSNRSQKGLFHGVTHHGALKTCFSEKKTKVTKRPNYNYKRLYSDILQMYIRLPITTTALKNIVKKGCLDNYILLTKEKKMNSKMGMFLRNLMLQKMKNPNFIVPYIPFQATPGNSRRRRAKYMTNLPSVYIPLHVKQNEDLSRYHLKTPDQMTREDMAELEVLFKDPETNRNLDKEWKKKQPYYQNIRAQMIELQPKRHEAIRKYWEINKKNKKARSWILEMAQDSEEFPEWILEEDYVHFRTAIPEIDEYLAEELKSKQSLNPDSKRTKIGDIRLRIGNKDLDFNAYDQIKAKKEDIGKLKKEYKG